MIRRVRCSEPSFHTAEFGPGLNVVLADRTQESTKTDSRNGLGKSTLIEIIHFCLGSAIRKNTGLLVPALEGCTFTLDLILGGNEVSVARNTASPNMVAVDADFGKWPARPEPDGRTGALLLPVQQWRDALGYLMFGLPPITDIKYAPTFRGLISFFIRRTRDAYSLPFETHRKQVEVDKQVDNSFLLGLEWRDAAEFQILKDRKKAIESLQQAAQEGLLIQYVGSRGELEALRVRLESRTAVEQNQIETFRVHPQYEDIVRRADDLTSQIHELNNQTAIDRRYLTLYTQALTEEKAPSVQDVRALYAQAGAALPGTVVQRLDAVEKFHGELIANRREFLSSEITRLRRDIDSRAQMIGEKTSTRAELMALLKSHGALQEYTSLQQLHSVTLSQLEEVKRRIQDLKSVEEGKSALAIDQEMLLQRARRDLEERAATVNEAIRLFNVNSEALYSGAAGTLVVEVRPTGFHFRVDIERSGSQGIDSMKVFCYDLTLSQLWARKSPSPGFLVHDSTIFDGVDERQIAAGLERAARESRDAGFQYICALNSDTVPWREFSAGFDLNSFVKLRLTDATESGRLLGKRF